MPQNAVCGFCKRGTEAVDICGPLHEEKLTNGEIVSAHHKCMQYSALLIQYKFEHFGGFKLNAVQAELQRGKKLKCSICKTKRSKNDLSKRGATSGCALRQCSKTFHFYCAFVDNTVITKRLVVNLKKVKTAVLYRVFCCEGHKLKYINNLKTNKDELFPVDDSDSSGEDDEWEDWREFQEYGQSAGDNTDVSFYDISSPEKKPEKKTSPGSDTLEECAEVSTRKRKKHPNKRLHKSCKHARKSTNEDSQDNDRKSQQTPKKTSFVLDNSSGIFKLPTNYSPIVKLASINDQQGRESPSTSTHSEASSSTLSYGTSSNGNSTPDLLTRLPSTLRNLDMSQKVTNVPANSVAVCILSDLHSSMDEEKSLLDLVQNRYVISKNCVYIWHRVVTKHGMESPYMFHFISDLTESLLDGDVERIVQLLICPNSQGLLDKYQNILAFQEKLERSIRAQLDQGICTRTYKGLKKLGSIKGYTVGEILPLVEECVLVLLINPSLTGAEDLLELFSLSKANSKGGNSAGELYSLRPVQEVSGRKKKSSPTLHVDTQEDMQKLMWWCVSNISGPVQLQVLPLEREILCSEDPKELGIAFRTSQFLKKMYVFHNSEATEMKVVCILNLDESIIKPYEYLVRILKRFLTSADKPCYAFVDVKNVNTDKLLNEMLALSRISNKHLEFLSTIDPEKHSPATVIFKVSDKVYVTQSVSDKPEPSSMTACDTSNGDNEPEDGQTRNYQQAKDASIDHDVVSSSQSSTVRYVEDGQVPSTSKQRVKSVSKETKPKRTKRQNDCITNRPV